MLKIRKFKISDINKIKKMALLLNRDNYVTSSRNSINLLSMINCYLPLKAKFVEDTYVAVENDIFKGVISLCPRRNNQYKWRIRKLLFDEASFETGKTLVDYVVTKYGALGIETFEAEIDSNDTAIIDLFSKSCGFRYCMDYQLFDINTNYYKERRVDTENLIFRPFKDSDKNNVADLYNQNISPYYKFSMSKTPQEFCDSICKGLSSKDSIKFVIEDKFSKQIRGFINILTENNKCFILELAILSSYEDCFKDIITFAISQIIKRTSHFSLYFKNCKFHANSDIYEKYMYEIDNKLIKTDMIFVRDFFKQLQDEITDKSKSVIYNEINGNPAYKI